MIRFNLQLFGGRGGVSNGARTAGGYGVGSGAGGSTGGATGVQAAAGTANNNAVATAVKSPTTTGGKIQAQGSGQWYGENDNGTAVSILDGGKDDTNFYRYGSRQIYEVNVYDNNGDPVGSKKIFTTKKAAMDFSKKQLKAMS